MGLMYSHSRQPRPSVWLGWGKVCRGMRGQDGTELVRVCTAVYFDGWRFHRDQDGLVRRAEQGFRFIPDGADVVPGEFVVHQHPVVVRHGGIRAEQATVPKQRVRLVGRGLGGFSDDLDAYGAAGILHMKLVLKKGAGKVPHFRNAGKLRSAFVPVV